MRYHITIYRLTVRDGRTGSSLNTTYLVDTVEAIDNAHINAVRLLDAAANDGYANIEGVGVRSVSGANIMYYINDGYINALHSNVV